jgi:hypothetical protein
MHLVFVIVIERVRRDESLTVSLFASGCGEDEEHTQGKVHA